MAKATLHSVKTPPVPESPAEQTAQTADKTTQVVASLLAVLEAQGTIPKDTAAHLKGQL